MQKRIIDVAVISDVHLGTLGCHAKELLAYLNAIDPKILVLNGDIIDIWNFTKLYWPETHMAIIRRIMAFVASGIPVYYLTGNHDELLRKFSGLKLGNFHLCDKLLLDIDGRKCWIFHGDVFDVTMRYSKWLARLGAIGYDILIMINKLVNFISQSMGRGKISLSKRIKDSVKQAVNFVDDFEKTAVDLAIENGYDYVVCGHIHKPQIRECQNEHGRCIYLNSGDWIENHTALEYADGHWSLYRYPANSTATIQVPLTLEQTLPILGIRQVGIRELEVA
jgi:UDP-2,3-diacylglucosamine pyrophosphatase LpxH